MIDPEYYDAPIKYDFIKIQCSDSSMFDIILDYTNIGYEILPNRRFEENTWNIDFLMIHSVESSTQG